MNNYYRNREDEEERRREAIRQRKGLEMLQCIDRRDLDGFRNLVDTTNLTDGWRIISQPPYLLHKIALKYNKPDQARGEESMHFIRMVYENFITPPRSMWYLEDDNECTIWKIALHTHNTQFIDFLAQSAVSQDITVSNDRRGESAEPHLASMLDKLSMLSISKADVKNTSFPLDFILESTILHKRMSQVIGMEDAKKKIWNEKILDVLKTFFAQNGKYTTFIADISKNTFLHLAILGKNEDAIQFLMRIRVHHDVENAMGMTPLNLAVETNQDKLFKHLCGIGARIHWFFEPENEETKPKIQAISARPSFAKIATNIHNLQKQHVNHHLQKFEEALRGVKVVSNLLTCTVTKAYNGLKTRTFHIKREELCLAGKEYALALLPARYSSKKEFGICDCLIPLERPPKFLNKRLVKSVIDSELKSNFYELKSQRYSHIKIQIGDGEKEFNSVLAVIISFDALKSRTSNLNGAGPSSSQQANLHKPSQHGSGAKRRRLAQ